MFSVRVFSAGQRLKPISGFCLELKGTKGADRPQSFYPFTSPATMHQRIMHRAPCV